MHFAQRAYVLLMLTAVLAVAGIWSSEPGLTDLWRIPALLLLLGLAYEGWLIRKATVTAGRGRRHAAPFWAVSRQRRSRFHNESSRAVSVE